MPTRKTDTDFVHELKKKAPYILPLETYTNSKTKIKCECIKCGNQWASTPSHLLSGRGCPECSKKNSADKRRLTKDELSERVSLLQPNIEIVGNYVNSQTKIEVYCRKCDNRWSVVPSSLLRGTGCPKCNKRYRRNTNDFVEELKTIDSNIAVLGEFKSAHEKILVKCNRCEREWFAIPHSLLRGSGCPFCSHSQTSIVEQILLNSFCVVVGRDNVFNRNTSAIGRELDIYIPIKSFAIEFGAWYWHSDKNQNDYEKEKLCERAGIHLITIYEGCPKNIDTGKMKNAICFSEVLSSEKDYATTRDLVIRICKDYELDSSIIEEQWQKIIKQSKDDSLKMDSEHFTKELAKVSAEIKYVGDYSGMRSKVHVRCTKCGTNWYASSAYDLLHGSGCPKCAKIKRSKKQQLSPREYKTRVASINPHIEVLEEYNGNKNRIACRCKICGTKWNPIPNSILYDKRNCPNCSSVTKRTDEQFREQLANVSDNIIALDDYINGRTRIRFRCQKCGYEWSTTPATILKGKGCPSCLHHIQLTQDGFVARIKKANSNIEILGKYINSKTPLLCRCLVCGHEWLGNPNNLLNGAGCPNCAGTVRLTNEEFLNRLKTVNNHIEPLDSYINLNTKIRCKCDICGNKWSAAPHNLLNGHGCPKCKADNAKKRRERRVMCIETGKEYASVMEAKKVTGITTISDCLNHRTKTAGNLHWIYLDNFES